MRRLIFCLPLLALFSSAAFGQSTTVSATITDAGGQAWIRGTYSFVFKVSPTNPTAQYFWNGAPFSSSQTFQGDLDGSGHFSVSIPSNTAITPSGSTWVLTVCSVARGNSPCYTTQGLTITGVTQDLSGSVVPPAISIDLTHVAYPFVNAYTSSEITTATFGGLFYNFLLSHYFICEAISPTGVDQTYGHCTLWVEICQQGDTTCGGAGAAESFQHNGTLVGTQPTFNIIDTGTVVATMVNDTLNNRVNVSFSASGGGGAVPCTTLVAGTWDIIPQTCAGEKVIQGIAGNPTVKNFALFPASDQTAINLYAGDLAASFTNPVPLSLFGDNPLTDSFHISASFNRVQAGNPMFAAHLAYNEDHTGGVANPVLGLRCVAAESGTTGPNPTVQACEGEAYNVGTAQVNVVDAFSGFARTGASATSIIQAGFYSSRNAGTPGASPGVRGNYGLFVERQQGIGLNNYSIFTQGPSGLGPFFVNADTGHVNFGVLETARTNPLCYSTTSIDTSATFVASQCADSVNVSTWPVSKMQTITFTGCTVAAGTYNECSAGPITWGSAFADSSYGLVCMAKGTTNDSGSKESYIIYEDLANPKSATQFTVLMQNNRGSTPISAVGITCIGIHP